MGRYITPARLTETPGAAELSQTCAQDGELAVPPALLTAITVGGDTSLWSADELVLAQVVLDRINEAITDAESLIDGYLRQRGYRLPLTTVPVQLTRWARAIIRYQLNRNRIADATTDPVVRDYRDALAFLEKVAAGKYSLGLDDPMPAAGGKPMHTGPGRIFDMHSLKDFGK